MAYGKKQEKGYREFTADIKKEEFPSSVLLYGEERFLVEWAGKEIEKRFINEATRVMDEQIIDDGADMDDILEALYMLPVMSERRVVIIDAGNLLSRAKPVNIAEDKVNKLIDAISSGNSSVTAVFTADTVDGRNKVVKAIKSSGEVYEMTPLDRRGLMSFAAKRLHAAGVRIGDREMDTLIRATGYDNRESDYRLYNFQNDLNKLIALTGDGYVNERDILSAVSGDKETFIFDLLDSISGNDKKNAFQIINNRLERDQYEAMSLVGSIASQLEIMLSVKEYHEKEGLSPAAIHSRTGLNEYRVKKALGYATRYETAKIRSMLKDIYSVNLKIISGMLEPRLALEMFVAGI